MGFGSLSIATSGIRVAQTNLAITGHNVANAEIPGYSRQRTVQQTSFTRAIGQNNASDRFLIQHGVNWNAVHQIRNEFLDISYRQNVGRLAFHSTKVNVGLQIETLLGELHGGYNFQGVLNDMWYALQELSGHPDGIETRTMLLATANAFIAKAQAVYNGLLEYQYNLDAQIRQMVEDINDTIAGIQHLNTVIRQNEASGDNANDHRDERNRLIDRLAEMIPIYVFTDPLGDVGILSNGHQLLNGNVQQRLGLRFITDNFSFVEPVVTNATGILMSDSDPSTFGRFVPRTPINDEAGNDFGQLHALLIARGVGPANRLSHDFPNPDEMILILQGRRDNYAPGTPEYLAWQERIDRATADLDADWFNFRAHTWSINHAKIPQVMINLDRIVFSVVSMINDMLTGNLRGADGLPIFDETPLTLDEDFNNGFGIPLFVRRDHDRAVDWSNWGAGTPWNDEDVTDLRSIFTIQNLQINPAFAAQGGHNLLALNLTHAPGDNRLLLRMLDVWQSNQGPYRVNIGAPSRPGRPGRYFNVQDAYIAFTATMSADIAESNSKVSSLTIQVQQAQSLRLSIKGVSMDEELNSMLRFQFAFQSASRVFNVIDSMIETVIGLGRR